MTDKNLLDAGYGKFMPSYEKYDMAFGKWFCQDKVKLYYLVIRKWDFTKYNDVVRYDMEIHLYKDDRGFVITRSIDSLKEAEDFATFCFNQLGCIPDPHNN